MKESQSQSIALKQVTSGFSYVAAWQALVFFLLLLLVWVNEVLDFSYLFFGSPRHGVRIFDGCIASAGVLVAAIVTIGNTYVQQQRIVSGLLTICSYCKKIRLQQDMWQQIEEYIGKHSAAAMTHGICPECFKKVKQEIEDGVNKD